MAQGLTDLATGLIDPLRAFAFPAASPFDFEEVRFCAASEAESVSLRIVGPDVWLRMRVRAQ